jgi:hypothetical protein
MTGRVLLVLALLTGVPAVSGAQVFERPQRERARSESTDRRQVTLSATTFGSYDDNIAAEQTILNTDIPPQAGYTGYADTTLRLEQGKASRRFDVSARGYVNSFRNVGLSAMYGADAQVHFLTGTRHRLEVWQGIRNEPFYNIGGFAALRQSVDIAALPDENPLNGSLTRRSWAAVSRVDFTSQWSPRNSGGMSLAYDTRNYRDLIGDTRGGVGSLWYTRNIGRRSRLKFSYGYADSQLLEPSGWIPLRTQTADGGLELERRFSSTRRILVSFGGGAVRARTLDRFSREIVKVWVPAGFATMRLDWARTWGMTADYRRSVAALQGITGDAFTTDAALIRLGGFAARPLEVGLSVGYATGQATAVQFGSYGTITTNAQLRVHLSSTWSALVSHDRYDYAVRGIGPVLRPLPENINRNAVRVGLAMNLPLGGPRSRHEPIRRD